MPINTKDLDVKLEEILKKVFKIEKINLESSMDDISEWDSFFTTFNLLFHFKRILRLKYHLMMQ